MARARARAAGVGWRPFMPRKALAPARAALRFASKAAAECGSGQPNSRSACALQTRDASKKPPQKQGKPNKNKLVTKPVASAHAAPFLAGNPRDLPNARQHALRSQHVSVGPTNRQPPPSAGRTTRATPNAYGLIQRGPLKYTRGPYDHEDSKRVAVPQEISATASDRSPSCLHAATKHLFC